MTAAKAQFSDLSGTMFSVPARIAPSALMACMVFERGTRSYAARLADAGILQYADLHDKNLLDILKAVPTTRPNFDRALYHLAGAGVTLVRPKNLDHAIG